MSANDFKNALDFIDFKPAKDVDLDAAAASFEAELRADEDVYARIRELGLTRKEVGDNLGMLLDYKADFSICRNCPGLEKCPKSNPGYALDITKDNGYLERRFTPCHKVVLRMKRDARYILSDMPDEWKEKNFNDVDMSAARNVTLRKLLTAQEKGNWFYLNGGFNSGKSYILACFANQYAEDNDVSVAFVDTTRLIDRLRNYSIKDKKSFSEEMSKLTSVPLLVLDGFGNEYKSDFAFSTVLYPLLSERARNKNLTFFTSDFSYKDIEEMYAKSVGLPRAKQLISLIKSMCGKEAVLDALNVY
ncbi:MAG: ATP-binding protein [Bacilli bacterium]|nr:ATP-binding protein [Bacilli bacterium]